jgi:ABC-type phosphate transport system substrate-binding protein
MKRNFIKSLLLGAFTYSVIGVSAQEIRIDNVKFVHPIVEKWVSEYRKAYPDSKLQIVAGNEQADKSSIISVVTREVKDDAVGKVVYFGRYALIPVSNEKNPLLSKVGKGLKAKDLKNLVFEKNIDDEDEYGDEEKPKFSATVYSRSGQSPTTAVLAEHYDRTPELIKGKKIVGDEIYIIEALRKDENGIAFNTLNYVYDLRTRSLKTNLAVLPLNLKAEIREALQSKNIDRTIVALEASGTEAVPIENFGLAIPATLVSNSDIIRFASWVLENGQKYNHELGFLTLDPATLALQQKKLKNELLTLVQ